MSHTSNLPPALLATLTCLLGSCSTTGAPTPGPRTETAIIHTVTASPEGILVNAYLIETDTAVIVVDSALTVSDTAVLRARVTETGKPLAAVLVTHGHPDHYNGIAALVEGRAGVPIYATKETAEVIRAHDAAKEAQWRPVFGEEWPATRAFPNQELGDGETVQLEGLTLRVQHLGQGESHADAYWVLEGPESVAFVGDVVMHGVHAYVSDGHTGAWLSNLERLRADLAGIHRLYPGHGTPGGLELLDWQQVYLNTYRAAVDVLREGTATVTEANQQALTEQMQQAYPDTALDFLIGLGASAVAAELALAAEGE